METSVLHFTELAIRYALLGVLVTMPPTLLLGLGLGRRGRVTRAFFAALLFSSAILGLAITIQGLYTGQVFSLTRSGDLMVARQQHPEYFWISAAVWAAGSCAMLGWAMFLFAKSVLPSNRRLKGDATQAPRA